jgi:hypothetical protein
VTIINSVDIIRNTQIMIFRDNVFRCSVVSNSNDGMNIPQRGATWRPIGPGTETVSADFYCLFLFIKGKVALQPCDIF